MGDGESPRHGKADPCAARFSRKEWFKYPAHIVLWNPATTVLDVDEQVLGVTSRPSWIRRCLGVASSALRDRSRSAASSWDTSRASGSSLISERTSLSRSPEEAD